MSNEHVEAEEQDEHGRAVLEVTVQFPNHSAQPKQADNFESTEKASDSLEKIMKYNFDNLSKNHWRNTIKGTERFTDFGTLNLLMGVRF